MRNGGNGMDLFLAIILGIVLIVVPICGLDIPSMVRNFEVPKLDLSFINIDNVPEFNIDLSQEKEITDESLKELIDSVEVAEADNTVEYNREAWEGQVTIDGENVRAWMIEHSLDNQGGIGAYDKENADQFSYVCPYNGDTITTSRSIDRDHIIPVHYAHQHGFNESTKTSEELARFYYNVDNSVNVCASSNRTKSDKGPSEYMPEINKAAYCYSWLVIAKEYGISIAPADMEVIKNTLADADIEDIHLISQYDTTSRNYKVS